MEWEERVKYVFIVEKITIRLQLKSDRLLVTGYCSTIDSKVCPHWYMLLMSPPFKKEEEIFEDRMWGRDYVLEMKL